MIKSYITRRFKYQELADEFILKIKNAITALDTFPGRFPASGFVYRNKTIYLKSKDNGLIFYIIEESKQKVYVLRIMHNRMNWKAILERWLCQNRKVALSAI